MFNPAALTVRQDGFVPSLSSFDIIKSALLTPVATKSWVCGIVLLVAGASASAVQATTFVEVANSRGLTHDGTTYGAAWTKDANGDGRPDLWLGNHSTGSDPILYLSTPTGFTESSALTGLVSDDFHGSAWADFNNDGNQDLLVITGGGAGNGQGANQLFVGDGNQWQEQAVAYNLDYPLGRGRHASWFDWNNDGFLDVALINKNDRPTPPDAFSQVFTYNPGTQSFIEETFTLHNQINQSFAQLSFSNAALGAGVPMLVTWARGGTAGPDISLSYGPGGLSNVDAALGLPILSFFNDAIPGDFDNDGAQDIFAANGSSEVLLLQTSTGFIDASSSSGIATNLSAFIVAADFNNDMLLDIYIARSNLGQDTNRLNELFLNQGGGTFTKLALAGGAGGTLAGLASGATAVDYNNDGWMDIFTTNSDNWFAPTSATLGAPMQLFENSTNNGNGWLKIVLQGTASNRDGIGAVVTVDAGGVTQMREMNGGIHHRSQDDPRLHFGLAGNAQADMVTITWPSGVVQQIGNVVANQIITVIEQGNGNIAPNANFTSAAGTGPLDIDFDATASFDPDGSITNWDWDFGDGQTGTGEQTTHSFPATGTFAVELTVTDDNQATTSAAQNVEVVGGSGNGSSQRASATPLAVGALASLQNNLVDEFVDGTQKLSTYWRNNNVLANAWVTLDLGDSQTVTEVRIATREKKQHFLEFTIGNNLTNSQVDNGSVRTCTKPKLGTNVTPSSLFACILDTSATGRYITIRSTNAISTRIYGVEIWVSGTGNGGGNATPNASFTASPMLLEVDFDGSNSTDPDGSITAWDWVFDTAAGSGATGSGEFASYTYSDNGSYSVRLTVTDDLGAQSSSEQTITVSDGASLTRLPIVVEAVSARPNFAQFLIDELSNGEQRLSSRWNNKGQTPDSWITLDVGAGAAAIELRIAPRGDRAHSLAIEVGDNLSGGRVTGGTTSSCSVPVIGSSAEPAALSSCNLTGSPGRYITVLSPGDLYQRIYGVEVFQ